MPPPRTNNTETQSIAVTLPPPLPPGPKLTSTKDMAILDEPQFLPRQVWLLHYAKRFQEWSNCWLHVPGQRPIAPNMVMTPREGRQQITWDGNAPRSFHFYCPRSTCGRWTHILGADIDDHRSDGRDLTHMLATASEASRRLSERSIPHSVAFSSYDDLGPRGIHVYVLFDRPQPVDEVCEIGKQLLGDLAKEVYPKGGSGWRPPRGHFVAVQTRFLADLDLLRRSPRRSGAENRRGRDLRKTARETTSTTTTRTTAPTSSLPVTDSHTTPSDLTRFVPSRGPDGAGDRNEKLGQLVAHFKGLDQSDDQVLEHADRQWQLGANAGTVEATLEEHLAEARRWLSRYDPGKGGKGKAGIWGQFFTGYQYRDDESLIREAAAFAEENGLPAYPLPLKILCDLWECSLSTASRRRKAMAKRHGLTCVHAGGDFIGDASLFQGSGE